MKIANIMIELIGIYPNYFRLWKLAQTCAQIGFSINFVNWTDNQKCDCRPVFKLCMP